MILVNPAPPRAPVAPEEKIARGDITGPSNLCEKCGASWNPHEPYCRDASPEVGGIHLHTSAKRLAKIEHMNPRATKAVFGKAPEARRMKLDRDSDADEVLPFANGPVVAGED